MSFASLSSLPSIWVSSFGAVRFKHSPLLRWCLGSSLTLAFLFSYLTWWTLGRTPWKRKNVSCCNDLDPLMKGTFQGSLWWETVWSQMLRRWVWSRSVRGCNGRGQVYRLAFVKNSACQLSNHCSCWFNFCQRHISRGLIKCCWWAWVF